MHALSARSPPERGNLFRYKVTRGVTNLDGPSPAISFRLRACHVCVCMCVCVFGAWSCVICTCVGLGCGHRAAQHPSVSGGFGHHLSAVDMFCACLSYAYVSNRPYHPGVTVDMYPGVTVDMYPGVTDHAAVSSCCKFAFST